MTQCRSCDAKIEKPFLSLGMSPLSNRFLSQEQVSKMEPFYPLETYVCPECFLVQLKAFESPENIFSDYVYFSSYSTSWLDHVKNYSEKMVRERSLGPNSMVVEIASNDGYLLQFFKQKKIPVLGIEPAANVAAIATKERGIPSLAEFFSEKLAKRLVEDGFQADLMVANNVLAHVPNLNDFVLGFKRLLKPMGVATFEFPHLMKMIDENQFDTIYHEHFSYFSLLAVIPVFLRAGLEVFDVEELPTHGGSLRLYVKHQENKELEVKKTVSALLKKEKELGYGTLEFYDNYRNKVVAVKRDFLEFLIEAKRQGKKVLAYGAAAKGNTLLNFCGIREDFIDFVADKNPHKQSKFLPGVHIPVRSVEQLIEARPDYVVILPWNIRREIETQLAQTERWGGKFVVAIPKLEVF